MDKESVAIVIMSGNKYLAVKRADDDTFGGLWGLPAASVRGGETLIAAAHRAAKDKLGVAIKILTIIGERTKTKNKQTVHLTEYSAVITAGEPSLAMRDKTVSRYTDFTYTDDPRLLLPAAKKGSICSRIFLVKHGISWRNGNDQQ